MRCSLQGKDEYKEKNFKEKESFGARQKILPEPSPDKIFTAGNVRLLKQDKETRKEFNGAHYIYQKASRVED